MVSYHTLGTAVDIKLRTKKVGLVTRGYKMSSLSHQMRLLVCESKRLGQSSGKSDHLEVLGSNLSLGNIFIQGGSETGLNTDTGHVVDRVGALTIDRGRRPESKVVTLGSVPGRVPC